jgi:hypothetical protein
MRNVRKTPEELEATSWDERVRLQEVPDAGPSPAGSFIEPTYDDLVALDERHAVAVASERRRSCEPGHTTAEHG